MAESLDTQFERNCEAIVEALTHVDYQPDHSRQPRRPLRRNGRTFV